MDSEHMLARLDALEARFNELTRLLGDPDIAQDYEKVAEYAKERADLEEKVSPYHRYKQIEAERAAAGDMLEDADEEIR
jgi:peptide chain release factor 1